MVWYMFTDVSEQHDSSTPVLFQHFAVAVALCTCPHSATGNVRNAAGVVSTCTVTAETDLLFVMETFSALLFVVETHNALLFIVEAYSALLFIM
jgi:hypothetical protein